MPGQALLEIVGAAGGTLKTALEAFRDPPHNQTQTDPPTRRDVVSSAERVKADAAKVGVMCSSADGSDAASLPPDAASSLVAALQQSALGFCATCYALSGATAGVTLRKELQQLAAGVVEPCIGLLRTMESGGDIKRAIGHVWEGCDAAAKAALDNRSALFKGLAKVMLVLKDTLREMEELEEEGGSSGSEEEGCDASKDGDEGSAHNLRELSELDFETEKLTGHEHELLTACRQLMEGATAVLKVLGRAMLQGPPLTADGGGPGGSEILDGWESALYHARNLQRCVEDLGAAMYPPQDLDEASSAAEAVATTAELMVDECPAPDAAGEDLGKAAEAVRVAAERVESSIAAAKAAAAEDG